MKTMVQFMKLSDPEYLQINQALFSLVNAYQNRANLEPSGASESLTVSERGVILVLGKLAPINLRRLAKVMQLSSGPVSQYVQKLVIKRLVEKEQDQSDRRNWWLRLTTEGERVYAETVHGSVQYTQDFLKALDDSEQHLLHDLLLKAARDLGYDW
jgi:DNA-binding MarR family transcriptional regulator